MEIKQEHRDWLDANVGNYETAKNGFIRNLELPDLQMYEHIYRTYLDPNFLLSVWCGACKFEMIMRLYKWYEQQPIITVNKEQLIVNVITEQPKKRGRKTKNNG